MARFQEIYTKQTIKQLIDLQVKQAYQIIKILIICTNYCQILDTVDITVYIIRHNMHKPPKYL